MATGSSEKSNIDAARSYIRKLRSMHPNDEVLRNLANQERELDRREQQLASSVRDRIPAHAGR